VHIAAQGLENFGNIHYSPFEKFIFFNSTRFILKNQHSHEKEMQKVFKHHPKNKKSAFIDFARENLCGLKSPALKASI